MTRTRLTVAAAGVLLALAGCSSDPEPAPEPAAAPSSASPSPTGPDDHRSCRWIGDYIDTNNFNPTMNEQAGGELAASSDAGLAAAGVALQEAAGSADNIAIAKAQLQVAEACADLFGEGNW